MIYETNTDYNLSVHILVMLKEKNLITEEEFAAIDKENQKSFQAQEYQGLS